MLKTLQIFLALFVFSQAALAHSKIDETSPENGALVQNLPDTIDLHFVKKTHLIKITQRHDDDDPIALDLGGYTSFTSEFSIATILKGAGIYTIEWRGLSVDGHPLRGELSFIVE